MKNPTMTMKSAAKPRKTKKQNTIFTLPPQKKSGIRVFLCFFLRGFHGQEVETTVETKKNNEQQCHSHAIAMKTVTKHRARKKHDFRTI